MTESTATASSTSDETGAHPTGETLTVRDNRTGQTYDVPILDGTIKAADIGKIKTDDDDPRAWRSTTRAS